MLKIKLLNEAATLNNFEYVAIKEYVAGNPFSIKYQIHGSEDDHRIIPKDASKMIAIFQTRTGGELTINCAKLFSPDDKSMWKVDVSAANSIEIVGSNVMFKLDFEGDSTVSNLSDASNLIVGMAYNILSKITFDGDC